MSNRDNPLVTMGGTCIPMRTFLGIMAVLVFSMYIAPALFAAVTPVEGISTTNGRTYRKLFVSTDPLHPTLIASVNGNRKDLWIRNVSTATNVRIYLTTSPTARPWDPTLENQKNKDLAFSTNAFPAPLTPYVLKETSQTLNAFLPQNAEVTQSTPIANPNWNPYAVPGIRGSTYHELEASGGWVAYAGKWYAVAVGSFDAVAPTSSNLKYPGQVEVCETNK